MKDFDDYKKEWMKNPKFRKAYDDLELEYALIDKIIEKRIKEGLTQTEIARRMGTKQSAISRFESGNYNPTLAFIKKLADALDVKLKITIS
ncbi:MAG: helix-turn-helix transcriptional regulator [Patescibacteria group bacterium]|nr:helix-turn-helix domain-containing protein [Patescibacteria group bacterium]